MCIQSCSEWYQNRAKDLYTFAQPAIEAGKSVAKKAYEGCQWLDRTIVKLTEDNLPKPLAYIVQDALRALPVCLAWLFLPPPVALGLMATYAIAHAIKGKIFCDQTYKNIYNGIGLGCGLECITQVVRFAVTIHPIYGIAALISGLASSYLLASARK